MSRSQLVASAFDPLAKVARADVRIWCEISKIIGRNSLFVDRTGLIDAPYRIALDPRCHLPSTDGHFSKTYEQICDERVVELLRLQECLRKPLCLLYSGGIDSTLMLVSILKRLGQGEVRDRVIVYLNTNSVNENPRFYRDHIRPRFRFISSEFALDLLNGDNLVVGAEFNDHLFGNYMNQMMALFYGPTFFTARYQIDKVREIFRAIGMSEIALNFWVENLERVRLTQNVTRIETMYDFFWWFNFNYRWQATYFSMILRMPIRFRGRVNTDFLNSHFHHFFMTDDFQRWSMLNPDVKIKETWESYKWPAKELIYRFNGDQKYRDHKIKAPSLNYILTQKKTATGLTDDFKFLDGFEAGTYLR